MDYSSIFNRAANIVWNHKFLIVLGFLASLGSGSFSGGGGGGGGGSSNVSGGNGQPFGEPGGFPEIAPEMAGLAIGLIIVLACVIIVVGLVLWVVSTIARGGLITAVDTLEVGESSSFGAAWRAGWQRAGTLIGIGILPAIPGFLLFLVALSALGILGGLFALFGDALDPAIGAAGFGTPVILLACILVPIALALSILRTFAERAAMLEGLGIVDSYRRGAGVLRDNLGEAAILFILQIVLFVVLGALLFLPGIILVLCCFLWPILMAIQGAVTAVVSAVWTLAWRQWTGKAPKAEAAPMAV